MHGLRVAVGLLTIVGCTSASTGRAPEVPSGDAGVADARPADVGTAATTQCLTAATFTARCAYDPACATPTDFQTDVLPTGACAAEDACRPIVRPTSCGCPRVPGPASFYDCACKGGQWSCSLVSQNANVCETGCDAGADAAHD